MNDRTFRENLLISFLSISPDIKTCLPTAHGSDSVTFPLNTDAFSS